MGESRQVLAVAVPKCELTEEFGDLTDTVGHDVELMAEALSSSGHRVQLLGGTQGNRPRAPGSAAPPAGCARRHRRTARSTSPEHGLPVGGADHLVPADAQLTWATTPPRRTSTAWSAPTLAKLLRGARVKAVLITVDACRDETGPASAGTAD